MRMRIGPLIEINAFLRGLLRLCLLLQEIPETKEALSCAYFRVRARLMTGAALRLPSIGADEDPTNRYRQINKTSLENGCIPGWVSASDTREQTTLYMT
jgi:hypothetical protein